VIKILNQNAFEAPTASLCASVMPAAHPVLGTGLGASIEGRRMRADIATTTAVVGVPAFLKDVYTGVRAWRPPV
jgi:hypothetical protein